LEQTPKTAKLPEALQRILTLMFTVLAALLYAGILGAAMVQTLLGGDATLTAGASRIATVLGGLVGAVVSAGFAGSWRPGSVQLRAHHPISGDAVTSWSSLRPPSRLNSKFASLARVLGFASRSHTVLDAAPDDEGSPVEESDPTAVGMALLYAAIYFLVGGAAFLLVLTKDVVPEIIESSAWTWVGSLVASAYTFFGLDTVS